MTRAATAGVTADDRLRALGHGDELFEVVDGLLVVKRVGGNPHRYLARRLAEELERQWPGAVATAPGQWAVQEGAAGVLTRGRLPDVLVDGDSLLTEPVFTFTWSGWYARPVALRGERHRGVGHAIVGDMTSEQDRRPAGQPLPVPVGTLASVSLDCADPGVLAEFYGDLLGMDRVFESPDGSVVAVSDGRIAVAMMRVEDHVPPTWPEPGQSQQLHLDISVTDLDTAVAGAVALGAVEAGHQPAADAWRVLIDPAGHPFCLTTVFAD